MGIRDLIASLQDNPYFGAGAGLFGVGAAAAVGRKGFQYANIFFHRHCVMSLEITSKDKSYPWVLTWISRHAERSTQHLGVETSFMEAETGAIHAQYHFLPSVGDHYFRYKSTWIKVERNREIRAAGIGDPWESVKLTAFGRDKMIYFQLLDEARQLALEKAQGRTPIYVVKGSHWEPFGKSHRRKRPIDSVILDNGISERIVEDVREFIQNPQWYHDRGIPYRRGYLLHGPPGCGKSSYITALAGELDYSISILSLGDRGISDDRLNYLLAHAEHQSIILLEDIDAAFVGRDPSSENPSKYEGMGALTFSGLLNALDGVTSSEARILFMTTNHIDRLDPALIRPGRVDYIKEISHCTDWQLQRMFSRFYPEADADQVSQFAVEISKLPHPVSPAMIQGHFMCHKNDSSLAIESIKQMAAATPS